MDRALRALIAGLATHGVERARFARIAIDPLVHVEL